MATIGGIGYQAESISSPNISAEAGLLGVRADVTSAQAGMRQVARAGAEVETLADKIVRQEDMTAVLEAKNESAIALNQGLIDFQSKITGDFTRDRTEWEAIASKIGQEHVKRLGSPVREQSFSKEFDSMHKASIIKIQNASLKNQMARFETASAGHFANAAKSAMGIVQAGPENYPAQVDAQFKSYEDIINASPLLSQAEKDSKVQAARQTFYLEVAKFQAETTPGAFSRDWRDGVWTKHLTPEAVLQLQPLAEKAQVDNAYNALTLQFTDARGNVDSIRAAAAARSPTKTPDLTLSQRTQLAGAFDALTSKTWAVQAHARAETERSTWSTGVNMMINGDYTGAYNYFAKSGLDGKSKLDAMQTAASGGKKATDPQVWADLMGRIANDDPQADLDLNRAMGTGLVSYEDGMKLLRFSKEIDAPSKRALKMGFDGLKAAMGYSAMVQQTPEQALATNAALQDLQELVEGYQKQGKDPKGLVMPGSPDYALERIATARRLTMQQQIEASTNKFSAGNQAAAFPSPSNRPASAPNTAQQNAASRGLGIGGGLSSGGVGTPLRIPGETIEQWRLRTGSF